MLYRLSGSLLMLIVIAQSALADDNVLSLPAQGMIERFRASLDDATWIEQPDHVLYRASEQKWHRLLRDTINLPNWIELSIQHRTRFESVSHPWRQGQLGETDMQLPQRTHIRFGMTHGSFSFLFEGIDARTHAQTLPNDFTSSLLVNKTDILQLFVSTTFRDTLGTGIRTDVHLGRFTFEFGSTRLVGRRVFLNVTQAFDGIHFHISKSNQWRVRAFLTEPIRLDPTEFDRQSAKYLFWGTTGEFRQLPWMVVGPYYLGLNDSINSTRRVINTYGLRLHKAPTNQDFFNLLDEDESNFLSGSLGFDYELEGAVQTGTRGDKDFFAHMGHAQAGYTFNTTWYPRFVAEYHYASGSNNPDGSQSQTFDSLFGIRRFDLTATGIFGPFARSNISSPGWRLVLKPRSDLQIFLKQHFWYLAQARDAFVGSNQPGIAALQDATGSSGNYLGHDLELAAIWWFSSNLILEAGYDHWFKGSYFDRLPASADLPPGGAKDSDYFYVSMQLRM